MNNLSNFQYFDKSSLDFLDIIPLGVKLKWSTIYRIKNIQHVKTYWLWNRFWTHQCHICWTTAGLVCILQANCVIIYKLKWWKVCNASFIFATYTWWWTFWAIFSRCNFTSYLSAHINVKVRICGWSNSVTTYLEIRNMQDFLPINMICLTSMTKHIAN